MPLDRFGGDLAADQMVRLTAQGMPAPRIAEGTFTSVDRVREVEALHA